MYKMTAAVLVAVGLVAVLGGCSKDKTPTTPANSIRPARVTDLYAYAIGTTSVRVAWTAVGADSLTGTAAAYDLRLSSDPSDTWPLMAQVSGLPAPSPSGARDSVTVSRLQANVTYRFLLQVSDAEGNKSTSSNPAIATTLGSDADFHWWPGFPPPPHGRGIDAAGSVTALVPFGGALVAGGRFTTVGDVQVSNVARWGGSAWSAIGAGLSGGPVLALAEYDGNLYAGGSFTQSGSGRAMFLAWTDGGDWTASRTEPDGSIAALVVYGGDLIAAGGFTHIGDLTVNHIAAWNGSAWRSLGSGADGWIQSLAVYNNDLIAGGYFTHAGGHSAVYVARWNGATWAAMGIGAAEPDSATAGVAALRVQNGSLYAGGNFRSLGGANAQFLAIWNGADWEQAGNIQQGNFTSAGVFALGSFAGTLVAGGRFGLAGPSGCDVNNIALVGPDCGALGSGIGRQGYRIILAMTEWDGHLFVGGTFNMAGNRPSSAIARWDGE